TGYAAIMRAAECVSAVGRVTEDPLIAERARIKRQLLALRDGRRVAVGEGKNRFILPSSVDDLAAVLEDNPGATIVAGSTDVGLWVTKFMREIGPVVFLSHLDELRRIVAADDCLVLGAGVSYTQAYPAVTRHFPQLTELWDRIGGQQVRNMGTIGGNVANGSPIGDTPPALIALGASVELRKGQIRRSVPIEDYFIEYGKQDRAPGEFVEAIRIPYLGAGEYFGVYKISKRLDEDISSVCGAFRIALDAEGRVSNAVIAFGGMAGTPERARAVELALIGAAWEEGIVENAIAAVSRDFKPLTDWRASADYRLLVAGNLLRRFYLETVGGQDVRLNRYEVAAE
ncbi:MAG: xanthine dehydrogenase small subunit, partial [Alphaproteobacteria bacterium]